MSAFIEVVRCGSVSRAADRLGVTQPSVSKAIRRLENEVGVVLIEKGLRGARLTSEGEMFLEAAKRFEAQRFDLARAASELRARHAGLLRLGITSPVSDGMAVQAASELVRRRPGMRLRLVIGKSDALDASVDDGELDLAVVPAYADQVLHCTRLDLGEDSMRVVARQGHPLLDQPRIAWADLDHYAWLMAPERSAARRHLLALFERKGAAAPRIAVETDYTSEAAMGVLVSTDLLSIVPTSVLRSWLGRVVPLQVPGLEIKRTLALLSRPGVKWSPLMMDFRDAIVAPRARRPNIPTGNARRPSRE